MSQPRKKGVAALSTVRPENVADLAAALASFKRVLILTHNNPDPDALASAAGVRFLLSRLAKIPSSIGYAGFLTRAQNREMVKRLRLPVRNVSTMDLRRFRAVVLVDSQPGAGNNPLTDKQNLVAVIDHHGRPRKKLDCPFCLLDPTAGATSTLVYEMLAAAGLKPTSTLATALFFGIKTDTQDLGRGATGRDLAAYKELFAIARHSLLAQIMNPRLSGEYYRVTHRALEAAVICGDCVYAPVGDVSTPEFVSEIADYLVSLQGMRWAVATARFQGDLHFSLRTLSARKDAGRILRKAIGRAGFAGGHRQIAGGYLPLSALEPDKREAAEARVISALFESINAGTANTRPLLAPTPENDTDTGQ